MGGTAAAFPVPALPAPAFIPALPSLIPPSSPRAPEWASALAAVGLLPLPRHPLALFPELQGDKSTALAGRHGAGDEGDDAYRKRKRRTVAGVVQGEGEEETR